MCEKRESVLIESLQLIKPFFYIYISLSPFRYYNYNHNLGKRIGIDVQKNLIKSVN